MADMTGNEPYQPSLFTISGRIGRLRYLAYSFTSMILCMIIFGILAGVFFAAMASKNTAFTAVGAILMLLGYIPLVAVGFILARRRFNDTGNTGWLSLLMFVPLVGLLVWFYLALAPGTDGGNSYGPPPGPNNALIVVGALMLPVVIVLGILAAIAIPAYQGYANKERAAKLEQIQQIQQQQSQQQSQ
jgi:uncharacterized membrane protein YhaH (DUF805 family)